MARLAVALLLAVASASAVQLEADKNRPVTKVIETLKNMITELEKEGEEDEETYQAMSCWCETNDQEKTNAIAKGERAINSLTASIEEKTATSSRLNTEIANLNKEVAKNQQALDSATALRAKQLAEFNAEEKDMLQSLTSLKGAIVAISKHNSAAFLQGSKTERELLDAEAAATIQHQLAHHKALFAQVVTPHQRKRLTLFFAGSDDTALLQSGAAAPQSGEVFGILNSMKETFETNMAASQKEENENIAGYNDLKTAKESEIEAGKEQIDSKTDELTNTDQQNADAKQSLEDTRNTLAADTEYLANLKESCKNADQEYEERTKTRQLEIQATSKALEFLSSDEAHDMFTRTFNFLQVSAATSDQTLRRKITGVLTTAAKKTKDPRLSALAVSATTKSFDKVKETIQTMVENLEKEQQDEVKHRDFCIAELTQNEDDTTSKNRDKSDLDAKLEELTMTISELTKEIDALKAAIAEASLQLKLAGENREKANTEFQAVVADQRATQALLKKALDILKGFYDKAALVQTRARLAQPAGPPPPAGFKKYEKSESSGGVMGMMQNIIDDAASLEAEATRAETDAQSEYETFVKDTNKELDTLNMNLVNKNEIKGQTEAEKVETEKEHASVVGDLESLAAANHDLHVSCDYTLKNFDARQATRLDEIEALKQSIAIFSGASFGAFMQTLR